MKSSLLNIVVFVAFLFSPLLSARLAPNQYSGGRSRNVEDRQTRNSSAVAQLLGEFRTGLSDLLFIKTERYLDSGIAYVPHIDKQELSVTGETAAIADHQRKVLMDPQSHDEHEDEHEADGHDSHAEDDDHDVPTIIRPKARDFRGFIGDLEREIKPFPKPDDPHQHTDGTELLPWYRLITLADPNNTRAYSIAGYWLKYHNPDEGLRFLEEGLLHNPLAFEMHLTYGKLLFHKGNELRKADAVAAAVRPAPGSPAEQYLLRAGDVYRRAAELALAVRPPDWSEQAGGDWDQYREDDALEAMRMAVMIEDHYGSKSRALNLVRDYQTVLPDAILERLERTLAAPAAAAGLELEPAHDHDHDHHHDHP